MISIFVNGHTLQVEKNTNLQQVLQLATELHQFDLSNIAVALNQHMVPKSQWAEQACQQGDHINLFSAVAGG